MNRRICMVGVKGIGKTTLNKKVLQRTPWIDYLIGSNVLRQLVGDDFDNFDTYSEKRKQYFREEAIRYMEQRQIQNRKDILVDGHTTLYNIESKKVERVFTTLDFNFFTDLIYYSTPAEVVLKRRKKDKKKKRIKDLEIIVEELDAERKESIRIANTYNMGWYEINEEKINNIEEGLYDLLLELHEKQIMEEKNDSKI